MTTITTITKDSPYNGNYSYVGSDPVFTFGGSVIVQPGAYVHEISTSTDGPDGTYIQIGGGVDIFDWYGSGLYIDLSSSGFVASGLTVFSAEGYTNTILNAGYIGGQTTGGLQLGKSASTQGEYDAINPDTVTNSGTISISRSSLAAVDVAFGTVTNSGLISSGYAESGNPAVHLGMSLSGGGALNNRGSTLDNSGSILGAVQFENGGDTLDNTGTIRGAVHLGDGSDTLDNSRTITGAVDMGTGNDTVTNTGTISGTLTLGTGFDTVENTGRITAAIDLGANADQFTGGSFAESVIGGSGDDFIDLGAGNDTYYATLKDGEDTVDGGLGGDTYNLSKLAAGVTFDLSHADNAAFGYDTTVGFENIFGTAFADTLTGTSGANTIWGGVGADRMVGLGGNDIYSVDNSTDVVIEAAGGGTDRVVTGVSYLLTAGSEIEYLSTNNTESTAALILRGNTFDNYITGNAGANTIMGLGGDDTMRGNAGNDAYYVDSAGDKVLELADEGNDRVITSVSFALAAGASIETLSTSSTTAVKLTGNELNNAITGGAGADTITGGPGSDGLTGGGSADHYVYNAVAESNSAGRDSIVWGAGDKIDLSTIDANESLAGNQAFTFIGPAAFSAPGQVREYSISSLPGTFFLEANTVDNSGAEMAIMVKASAALASGDFIL